MFYSVQKDFYLFLVGDVYYAQFRDPVTRKLQRKKSSGLRNRTMAEKWATEGDLRRIAEVLDCDFEAGFVLKDTGEKT